MATGGKWKINLLSPEKLGLEHTERVINDVPPSLCHVTMLENAAIKDQKIRRKEQGAKMPRFFRIFRV